MHGAEDDVPVVDAENLLERGLVAFRVVGLEAEEDVDPARELLFQGSNLLDVAGQLRARHRDRGIGILSRQEVEGNVVREGDLVEAPPERREDVLPHLAAGVAAAGRVDVIVGLVRALSHRSPASRV